MINNNYVDDLMGVNFVFNRDNHFYVISKITVKQKSTIWWGN